MTGKSDTGFKVDTVSNAAESTLFSVPSNVAKRRVTAIKLNEDTGGAQTITFRKFSGTPLALEWDDDTYLAANESKPLSMNTTQIYEFGPGTELRAQTDVGDVDVVVEYYDE